MTKTFKIGADGIINADEDSLLRIQKILEGTPLKIPPKEPNVWTTKNGILIVK